ncbi:hypothetical protein [Oleiharenicola lentus]|uniref:hypothetical protein n=1 Tax=Oleiharenicola lentus TaxID=2508720 RepID=UPI003F67251A
MKTVVTTLFEGDYHLGAAALINSLCAAGYQGTVVCGYRGVSPPWTESAQAIKGVAVEFITVETDAHLTNYKAEFLQLVFGVLHPSADQLFYFDPDIIIKTRWSFFEEWAAYGVALVEDVNSPLPESHPRRGAWRRCLSARGLRVKRETPLYANGGFIGVARAQRQFLNDWQVAMALVSEEIGGLAHSMFSFGADRPDLASPAYPFNKTDQDALNIALMTSGEPISVMGTEGMDFRPGGWTMAHALGTEKPWRKHFMRAALAGRRPSSADRAFWAHTETPLNIFPAYLRTQRKLALDLAGLIGRCYRRA